jgi:DNA-binding beta-propeller fold protein YncE
MKYLLHTFALLAFCTVSTGAQPKPKQKPVIPVVYNDLGITSSPAGAAVSMELYARFQHKVAATKTTNDTFDRSINSPKSVNYLASKGKFYVQSLEGHETVVYDLTTLKKIKVIKHDFTESNQGLFKDGEYSAFDYKFQYRTSGYNIFKGKPVESTFSHNGKFLWVTYYRRSYDANAQNPSAVAIIDTDTDEIVRVMPSGTLPKMIATSPDNRFVAVTHWGDNTVGIIDITSDNPFDFKYLYHLTVEKRLSLDFAPGEKIDRDAQCGYCLRGTVFTPDSKYLLVGRMGGGGIAVFNVDSSYRYMGVTYTQYNNIRHLVISGDNLLVSTNANGYIQKIGWKEFIQNRIDSDGKPSVLTQGWQNCYVGTGVRTISVSSDGKYVFACVNEASKIVAVDANTMKIVSEIAADSYPVGMEITDSNEFLFVTAQGKSSTGGGHSVMIYKLSYSQLNR